MTASIVLHQWEISPFCQKVARALRYKGLPFEVVNYNGMLATRVAGLTKVGKVPVLDIDGQRLQDSTRIVRHLDEHFPQRPLYPAHPQQRAVVELWEDWSDELLYWYEVYYRVRDPLAFAQAVRYATEGRPAYERLSAQLALRAGLNLQLFSQGLGRMAAQDVDAEFLRHLDRIETVLAKTGRLVGGALTIADLSVGSQLLEVDRTSARMRPQLRTRPALSAWLDHVSAV